MIRIVFTAVLVAHALLHLLGFAKGFELARLPQLTQPVSRGAAVGWLAAALVLVACAVALYAWPRAFWVLGGLGLVLSQALILRTWIDARFGTVANGLLLVAVLYGFLSHGPWSYRATFDREVAAGLLRRAPQPVVTEADLAPLPPPVRRYLRAVGVVGQPRIQSARFRFRGTLRGGPDAPWMDVAVDQVSFFDQRTRLFHVDTSRAGVPVEALHRFVGPSATFSVKVAALVTVTDASGPEMDRSETVTFLNDMAVLAPATLLSPALRWEPVDARTARVTYVEGGQTVRAELQFDPDGQLADFWSDDRSMASADGKSFRAARWSTPVHAYRAYGPVRLASQGEARWQLSPAGAYAYARFELEQVDYNLER
jgi:hypothetical protein